MTAISDFIASPSTFLRNNMLRARFELPDNPAHIRMFKFVLKDDHNATSLATAGPVPSYELVPVLEQEALIFSRNVPSRNRDYLEAYWCPYGAGQQHSIMVSDGANYMFTTNMDGCSFGVGSPTPTGARRVSHINLWNVHPQSRVAQNATLSLQSLDRHLIAPDDYMQTPLVPGALNGEIKATTFGRRNTGTGHWSFWYQQYRLPNNCEQTPVLVNLVKV